MNSLARCLSTLLLVLCSGPFCSSLRAEIRSLTILHTNDLHARISPLDSGRGGFAYLAAVITRERTGCVDCILLNAGDLVQGSPVSTIFRGVPIYEIANLLGFDASTLGNHEFDYGWQQTRRFIETAKYPVVSANMVGSSGKLLMPEPFVILRVNGLRVAVIGAMTDDLNNLTTPRLLGEWHTIPVVATVRRYAAELRDKSDLIVVLGHLTAEEEKQILQSAPEIPVTVSGHIHRGLEEPIIQEGRLVVRVKSYAEELGRLELQVDTVRKAPVSWKWRHIEIDSTKIAPDANVERTVKHWEDEVTARVDKPLAVSRKALAKADVKRLIEQALRDETGADFAFMNMGGVRDVLPRGQILVRNIWNVMPFDNTVLVGKFKGRDLPEVVVGDKKVDPEREYTLAVSDFTAANQGTAENLRVTGLQFPENAGLMRDLLLDWFRKKGVIGD